ncbi:putative short chain dehydrogenase [Phaeomoniella chlamydospora]|uniref:Putative short chain dehydrogenase n=1 Tax=Phaeomoniella chlamydospora TaxID=158046 RepID=A0A0G2F159_PHACM|nr:putative short chain dehydrogenase [Phaeomoniella chlamydospora]
MEFVVAAKTVTPIGIDGSERSRTSPGPNSRDSNISTVTEQIVSAGGTALAFPVNVRHQSSVKALFDKVVETWGSLDVLIYNAGAIWWGSVEETDWKRFKLMQEVNVEGKQCPLYEHERRKLADKHSGLYASIQASLLHWKKCSWNARVIVVSPPIYSRFFRGKTAYSMGKVGMSVLTKGLSMDWIREGRTDMAITSIWPASSIESAATGQYTSRDPSHINDLRKPTIFSDAIIALLRAPAAEVNGLIVTDEDFLRSKGVTDFSKYSVVPGTTPRRIMPAEFPVLEVAEQDDEGTRMRSVELRKQSKI